MMNKKEDNILIIGGDSFIGKNLFSYYKTAGRNVFKTSRRPDNKDNIYLDFEKYNSDIEFKKFNKVFLCAAMTNINDCDINASKAYNINVTKTKLLINDLIRENVFIIFLSSSLVYTKNNKLNSICNYGHFKLLIENYLRNFTNNYCIIRLSKVVHKNLPLIKQWIQELSIENNIFPFNDMTMSPICINYLAKCLYKLEKLNVKGFVNISSSDQISYFDAAVLISKKLSLNIENIHPISYKTKNIVSYQENTALDLTVLKNLNFPIQTSKLSLESIFIEGV